MGVRSSEIKSSGSTPRLRNRPLNQIPKKIGMMIAFNVESLLLQWDSDHLLNPPKVRDITL